MNALQRLYPNRLSVRLVRLLALLVLSLIAFASTARAADTTISWTLPTANTDGSTPAAVSGYNIYVASTDAALSASTVPAVNGGTLSAPTVLSYTFKNVAPGTYFYAVTSWFCAPSGGTCTESDQSAHVSKTVAPAVLKPLPPANVKAQ